MRELAHERQQRARSESALGLLCEGVHLLTLELKEADLHSNDNDDDIIVRCLRGCDCRCLRDCDDDHTVQTLTETIASEGDDSSFLSTTRSRTWSNHSAASEEVRLAELTGQLASQVRGDLMALQNAAHMVLDHAQLASQEASVVVEDTQLAQSQAVEYKGRALVAEKDNSQLGEEKKGLHAQVEKLTAERRLLVKEVRSLRKELASTKEKGMMEQLERYIVGALSMHEQLLKVKANGAKAGRVAADDVLESVAVEQQPTTTIEPKSQPKFSSFGGNVALGFGSLGSTIGKKMAKPRLAAQPIEGSAKEELNEMITPYEPLKFDLCAGISSKASFESTEIRSKRKHFFSLQTPAGRGSPLLDLGEKTQLSTPTTLNINHFESCEIEPKVPSIMPRSVSFDDGEDSVKSELPSPLVTPFRDSKPQIQLSDGPHILRSLAMPLVDDSHR